MTETPDEQSAVPAATEIGDIAPYDGPPLVYGLVHDCNLAVVPREWAERAADEFARWLAARTWREALAVAESMTVLEPPFWPHEQREELGEDGLDGPFDANLEVGFAYSEHEAFPTDPDEVTVATVPWDWYADAEEWLGFSPEEESRLLAVARAAGAVLVRDDDLVNAVVWPGDRSRMIAGPQPK